MSAEESDRRADVVEQEIRLLRGGVAAVEVAVGQIEVKINGAVERSEDFAVWLQQHAEEDRRLFEQARSEARTAVDGAREEARRMGAALQQQTARLREDAAMATNVNGVVEKHDQRIRKLEEKSWIVYGGLFVGIPALSWLLQRLFPAN